MGIQASRSNSRIELRTTEEIKNLLNAAAAQTGVDLTSFVMANVVPVAREIVAQRERLKVTAADFKAVVALLENPPPPTEALIALMQEKSKGHGIRVSDARDRKASRRK